MHDVGVLYYVTAINVLDDKTIEECALTNQRAVMDIVTVEALANQIMRLRHRYGLGNLIGVNITEAMLNANADGTIPDGQAKVVGPHGMTICGYLAPIIGNKAGDASPSAHVTNIDWWACAQLE